MAILLVLLVLVFSGCTSLTTNQSEDRYLVQNRRVPEDTLRMAISDHRDDFEGTREVSMLIYHKDRELIDLSAAYIRDGKPHQAAVRRQAPSSSRIRPPDGR